MKSIMYHIYSSHIEKIEVIHIIGRLNSKEVLESFLKKFAAGLKSNNGSEPKEIIIDLAAAELITNDCLQVLSDFKSITPVKFQNYTLYVELLLRESGLIETDD